jgi:hypothetical protein
MAAANAHVYAGPACPHCRKSLAFEELHDGEARCPHCGRAFEARRFLPPLRVVSIATLDASVEAATPCANHARNAAAASCQRCGIFICALCEIAIGADRFCPACFDRLAAEKALPALQLRFRDYARLAVSTALLGILGSVVLGIPLGIASLLFAIRGFRSAQQEQRPYGTLLLAIVLALASISIGSLLLLSFFQPMKR